MVSYHPSVHRAMCHTITNGDHPQLLHLLLLLLLLASTQIILIEVISLQLGWNKQKIMTEHLWQGSLARTNTCCTKYTLFKMSPSRPLFPYIRLFNRDSKQLKKNSNDRTRTLYHWCRMRPLYQLSHNHCPSLHNVIVLNRVCRLGTYLCSGQLLVFKHLAKI